MKNPLNTDPERASFFSSFLLFRKRSRTKQNNRGQIWNTRKQIAHGNVTACNLSQEKAHQETIEVTRQIIKRERKMADASLNGENCQLGCSQGSRRHPREMLWHSGGK